MKTTFSKFLELIVSENISFEDMRKKVRIFVIQGYAGLTGKNKQKFLYYLEKIRNFDNLLKFLYDRILYEEKVGIPEKSVYNGKIKRKTIKCSCGNIIYVDTKNIYVRCSNCGKLLNECEKNEIL